MQRTHREKPTNTNEIHTKHSAKYQQTFREIPTLTHEMGCEHSARCRGPIHRARILTLSNMYIHVIKYVHSHHRTHISTLSNTCIHVIKYMFPFHRTHISTLSITCFHIIKYTFPHHRTHISVCHFVGEYVYAGAINRSPTAANGLPKCCKRIAITLRTPTKLVANIPPGVGADSSRPYPNITKYTYPFQQIRISTLLNMYLCITKHAYSFHKIRVFVSPHTHFRPSLRGCFHICGRDKSAPTAANGLPFRC